MKKFVLIAQLILAFGAFQAPGVSFAQRHGGDFERSPGFGNRPEPVRNQWVYCASENQVCHVRSNRPVNVRYGANGRYAYRQVQGSIVCDNNNFGDPIYGVVKSCEYMTGGGGGDGHRPPPPPPTERWVYCGPENGVCYIRGNRPVNVRYGANGRYSYRQAQGQINCNNQEFGDPIYGVVKSCEYLERF